MISKCGVICATDCRAYKVECEGCNELSGKVSWAAYYDKTHCPIYACVVAKDFSTCGECGRAPCELWYSTRDPDFSDEAFAKDIASRLHNLKAISSH
jgi:hypothetical protein